MDRDRRLVEELATLRFVEERANCLLDGPPGVGTNEGRRRKALKYIMRGGEYGWLVPLLLTVIIFFFTTAGFSAATHLMQDWRMVDLSQPPCTADCALGFGDFFNFYTWHPSNRCAYSTSTKRSAGSSRLCMRGPWPGGLCSP